MYTEKTNTEGVEEVILTYIRYLHDMISTKTTPSVSGYDYSSQLDHVMRCADGVIVRRHSTVP